MALWAVRCDPPANDFLSEADDRLRNGEVAGDQPQDAKGMVAPDRDEISSHRSMTYGSSQVSRVSLFMGPVIGMEGSRPPNVPGHLRAQARGAPR
jgi:hypothetical protein